MMIDDQPLAPEQIEQAIREISGRIAKGVRICGDRYREYLTAEREYDRAYHRAYLAAGDRPAHERKSIAEMATLEPGPDGLSVRDRRDVADAAYRLVDRQAKALESELRALQSVGASIRAMFGVAGRGEQ